MTDDLAFSPTTSVRESCRRWLDRSEAVDVQVNAKCSVSINYDALDLFSEKITETILANKSLQVTEWDAGGWHYTGNNYRAKEIGNECHVLMKMERVALYVLAMDAINFCFWPCSVRKIGVRNCLEYEHLAIALKKVAEQDDNDHEYNNSGQEHLAADEIIQSASTYAWSPINLSTLTPQQLQCLLLPYLPESHEEEGSYYEIPDIGVRCQLLNELGRGILDHHNGSALHMIAKANQSADTLVQIVLDTFPSFRDFVDVNGDSKSSQWEAAKKSSKTVHFYKRAQIAVADLWAALGRCHARSGAEMHESNSSKLLACCQFTDMSTITTFPDYRVPQILRHAKVMKYEDELAQKVDQFVELDKGCPDEISIRAGTVVAVEDLVLKLKERLANISYDGVSKESQINLQTLANDVSAVTVDWYLWQQGEKLDRLNLLQPHHRVQTTFY